MVLRLLVLIFVSAKGKQGDELTSGRVDKAPTLLVASLTRQLVH